MAEGTATTTILFTDVVGSTELRGRLGEHDADRLFIDHRRRLGTVIARHGGRIVKYTGDGVMAAFAAASTAVRAAVGVQLDVAEHTPEIDVRVGAAVGDVTRDGDDYFGLPVVAAARLEAAAEPGQILVTESVRLLAGDRSGARFEPIGPLALKGLPEPVETYVVIWERPPASVEGATSQAQPQLPLALAGTARHPFVGRDDVLGVLRRVWEGAERGPGGIVLIGGEAGAGKTRLASEFAREAHRGGAWVAYGLCDEDLALPYQPWVQAADQLLAALPREAITTAFSTQLAPLAPLLSGAEWLATRPPKVTVDPDAERYRTYSAFATLLREAGATAPGLVVLDDLHWAGTQTLALLRHLARSGLPRGILVVAAFRDTGNEMTEPLAGCLADLRRVDDVSRLRLAGLAANAVERFVAAVVGHELDVDLRRLAAELTARSGGNAFYLAELWRHLVDADAVGLADGRWVVHPAATSAAVPDSVRDVVSARLAGMSAPARRVIELAALSGQQIDLEAIELAASLTSEDLEAAIEELVAAGLLAGSGGPTIVHGFEHAIVRDTVEAAIPSRRRCRFHLALAEAIETAYEPDRRPVLAELARHFAAAAPLGPAEKAVYYGRRAAAQAFRAAAYDEAVAHLDIVLGLAPRPVDRAAALVELGTAELRRASYEASRAACLEAYEIAIELDAGAVAADAAVGFEMGMHFPGLPGGPAVEMLSHALGMVGDETPETRARLLASLGRALGFTGRASEGLATAEAALDLARAVGDSQSLMVALQALATSTPEPDRQLAAATELAELAGRHGDPWIASYATANQLRAYIALGRLGEAAETLERHRATSTAGRFAPFQFITHAYEAALALAAADFAAAEAAADEAKARAVADEAPYDEGVYGLQMYAIRRAQGRLAEVAPLMRVLAATADLPPMWRPGLAALYAELGMVEQARAVFDALAAERFAAVTRDAVWPASLTFLAETCLALGDQEHASVLYDELIPFRDRNLMAGMTICFGPADRLLGGLAALLGRWPAADEHFRVALGVAQRSGSPLWTAEVQYDWAVVLARLDPDRARRFGNDAIATAKRHGIGRLANRDVPGENARAGCRADPELPDNLSMREGEVLRHVATGKSNREIGKILYISQNTVANHVRAILQKTGCSNRTEASLYAVRRGLLDG